MSPPFCARLEKMIVARLHRPPVRVQMVWEVQRNFLQGVIQIDASGRVDCVFCTTAI